MKEKVFKYSTLSLVLINFWTLYLFFAYFLEQGPFQGFGLLINYSYSLLFVVGFSVVLLFIRLFFFLKWKTNPLKANFFYILGGVFSGNIFVIWTICVALRIFEFEMTELDGLAIGSFLISLFIITDIFRSVFLTDKK